MSDPAKKAQPGILADVPSHGRHMFFDIENIRGLKPSLNRLQSMCDGEHVVAGFGLTTVQAMGKKIDGLHTFPAFAGKGFSVPSTPAALWCWLRGEDPGDIVHLGMQIETALAPALKLRCAMDVFRYRSGLDLTGFEDGTENPKDADAVAAGIAHGRGKGLNGSSFVAVQQWRHDLARFASFSQEKQDGTFGRRKSDNEELGDAPESAHVKRTAQEDFDPEAFVLRRSMPWSDGHKAGLIFVAFGKSLDAFEALLNRMTGSEDGITDALFTFTRPLTGNYFWCPPMKGGKLDLSAIGLN